MTDPLALVKTRLQAVAAVTTLVGTKIYAGALPQNAPAPAILLRNIDRVTESHLRGMGGLMMARVQVHQAGTTREQALAVASAVEGDGAGSALSFFSGTVSGTRVALVQPGSVDEEQFHAGEILQWEIVKDYEVHYHA